MRRRTADDGPSGPEIGDAIAAAPARRDAAVRLEATRLTGLSGGRTALACRDALIYLEGDPANEWFEVEYGVVMTCHYLPSGGRQVTGFFRAGQLFGVDHLAYRATAEAVTDVVLIARPRQALEAGRTLEADLGQHPLHLALQDAEERIRLLARKGAPARIAAFLLAQAVHDGGGLCAHLPMRRADIADYLGVDVATISRVLSKLVEQRAVSARKGQHYRLENVEALRVLCGEEASATDPEGAAAARWVRPECAAPAASAARMCGAARPL